MPKKPSSSIFTNTQFKPLAVALLGFVSILLIYPTVNLLVALTEPLEGCQGNSYALGCSLPGMILVVPVYIAVMTLIMSRVLKVKKSLSIVSLASLLLLGVLVLFSGVLGNMFNVADNIIVVWLSFAILAGLLFAILQHALDNK
jgi:hypothetical protein